MFSHTASLPNGASEHQGTLTYHCGYVGTDALTTANTPATVRTEEGWTVSYPSGTGVAASLPPVPASERIEVLSEEGAPQRIEAWNKVDLLSREERDRLFEEARRRDDVIPISAATGEGLEELRQRMAERLRSGEQVHEIRLPASAGDKIAWLHSRGEVLDQQLDPGAQRMGLALHEPPATDIGAIFEEGEVYSVRVGATDDRQHAIYSEMLACSQHAGASAP